MFDLLIVLLLVASIPVTFWAPFAGVYVWQWLSLMNPHRIVGGFSQDLPLNMVVALATIVAWALSPERKDFRINALMVLLGIFSIWISLTTLFAPSPEFTTPLWNRNIKTILLLIFVMALITNKVRVHALVWIMVVSLGYYGVKGGGFLLLTGGNYIVFGPPQSMIEDNNSLALAMIITLPLMNYLRLQTQHKFIKWGMVGAMALTTAGALGSYSRGGFIAFGVMIFALWLKSRAKVAIAIMGIIAGIGALVMMPDKYRERLATIEQMYEDESFLGRLDAWAVAWETAKDRPFGAGFDGPRQEIIWNEYRPGTQPRASHSIYFMVLGEHGFIGLGIYLAICAAAWRNLSRVIKLSRDDPEQRWAFDLASALQVSIVGFLVGGAALPMAYYDGFLTLLALSAILSRIMVEAKGAAPATTVRRRWSTAPVQV